MKKQRSSYKLNDYASVFCDICLEFNPSSILEIGILDGYSLEAFTKSCEDTTEIVAIDLFEDYEYKSGNYQFIKEMFKEHHGLQCGYCTPGMITRAYRLLQENSNPTEEDVRFGMSGNLCRCTGYQNIIKAILATAEKMNEMKESA